jgi:PIN domain nuclease of toxin-antitoxin system
MGFPWFVKYLLDTHTVLWIAESSARLSQKVRAITQSHEADSFGLAAITLLEIARLARSGEIILKPDPAEWLDDLSHRFEVLPLTPAIAWRAVSFDWAHKDPADRLICATTLEHKLTLVTNDREITRWGGVPVLW